MEEINGIEYELNSIVVEKQKGKPYRLVIQRQKRTNNIQEIWEALPSAIAYCNLPVVNLTLPYKFYDMERVEYYRQFSLL